MYRTIFALLLLSALFFAACDTAEKPTFNISGKITGTNAIALTQVEDINRKKVKLVGRIPVGRDGKFSMDFSGLEPHLYELNFPSGKKIALAIEKGQSIEVNGDAAKPEAIRITGSEDTAKLEEYEKFRKESLDRLVLSVRRRLKNLPQKSGPEFERIGKLEFINYVKHKDELLDFVLKKMGTSIGVYATSLRWPGDKNIKALEELSASFEKAHPNSAVSKRIQERVAVLKQTSVGGKVADIKMRDGNGKELSLFASKGKYTLIDFWGSWCGPCRREAKILSESYAKYKTKGFEIFAVALESDLKKWNDAKELDKRIWPGVVSLKEFDTPAAFDYGITALPANFLIDSDGKIIAKDLHDEELEAKLKELFGKG
jgi:thiol-disulfide isomerase/thioredoxin